MRSDIDVRRQSVNPLIHPTAVIGEDVEIGEGTQIGPYAVIQGKVRIGKKNRIFPGVTIGLEPQILGGKGGGFVEIGDENIFREHVTIHASSGDKTKTQIGNQNFLMVGAHIAHDCCIQNNVIITNNVALGGHVTVEDRAVLGGLTGVHQFVRIGKYAMVGGLSRIVMNILPFSMAAGNPTRFIGLNLIGLKRAGLTAAAVGDIKKAFNALFLKGLLLKDALEAIKPLAKSSKEVQYLVRFIEDSKKRGFTRKH